MARLAETGAWGRTGLAAFDYLIRFSIAMR
jgi:hypothetical protein